MLSALQLLLVIELASFGSSLDTISATTCGTQKSCFFFPQGCEKPSPTNCSAILTYSFGNDSTGGFIDFELQRRIGTIAPTQAAYLALGFNNEKRMAAAAVTACVFGPQTGGIRVILTKNEDAGYGNSRIANFAQLEPQMLSRTDGGVVNDLMICRFRQKSSSSSPGTLTLDQQQLNLLFANGPADPATLQLRAHSHDVNGPNYPIITEKVDLRVSTKASGGAAASEGNIPTWAKARLFEAHGILMIFGWWLFVPTAIFLARYFRTIFPNKQPCGIKMWFHFHRGIMVLAVFTVLAGFLCIVIKEEGKFVADRSGPTYAHAVCGLTAFIGILVQPVVAFFRCHPEHPLRPLYNWPHRIIGIGSFCCACAAIWLAQTAFEVWPWGWFGDAARGLMIFYFVMVCLTALLLEIQKLVFEVFRRPKIASADVPMQGMGGSNGFSTISVVESDTKSSRVAGIIRGVLLVLFVISALGVTIALTAMFGVAAATPS